MKKLTKSEAFKLDYCAKNIRRDRLCIENFIKWLYEQGYAISKYDEEKENRK